MGEPEFPRLKTERLVLRCLLLTDAPRTKKLAGDRRIADTTQNIPHPYEDGMAEAWIEQSVIEYSKGRRMTFAVVRKASDDLIGVCGLTLDRTANAGALGYWIGQPFWNQGYATEAAHRVVAYGIDELGLNRIAAAHYSRNPASGAVMRKLGMQHEGTAREAMRKWDKYEDVECYALLRKDWQRQR